MTNPSPAPAAESKPEETSLPPGRSASVAAEPLYIVLTGNPNCGKTTLFNALTGLRAKVGNYAGVTVERKEGRLLGAATDLNVRVLDLPGTYSLSPQSLDEQISRDVLLNRIPDLPAPSLIIIVVDASNLQRNLYYASQVIELGHPAIIALNMIDVARDTGHEIDAQKLAAELGVPVVPVIASQGTGLPELRKEVLALVKQALSDSSSPPLRPREFWDLPDAFRKETDQLATLLAQTFEERRPQAAAEALLLLSNEKALASSLEHYPAPVQAAVASARQRLESAGVDWRSAPIEARYQKVAAIQRGATLELAPPGETFSDKLDKLLTHKLWGTLIFVAIMTLMFESIFTFAHWPMEKLQGAVDWLGSVVAGVIPPGELNSLLVDGVIAGVGAVVVFLPQILILFLFIGFLEDTGYMARAAFLMDRLMSKVGLHGKSFIPMLSSFACAIPGIMATRTIESPKDRLVTILVSPLMSCSARLPVYTLLIGACIPARLQGLTMMGMYMLGITVALLMAWLFKKTLLKGEVPLLIMELPPYKRPLLRVVVRHMWDRSKIFLRRAGTVILGINILLWFLATYPHSPQIEETFALKRAAVNRSADSLSAQTTQGSQPTQTFREHLDTVKANAATTPSEQSRDREGASRSASSTSATPSTSATLLALDNEEAAQKLQHSFAGRMGHLVEPIIAPLGFDWKMGIGIISSFAAREVFVSAMSSVYSMGKYDRSTSSLSDLQKTLQAQRRPDGSPVYTVRTAMALMVFYVFALQCISTVAVVRRETNSWKWPLFQWIYMGALAWVLAFITWHLGGMFGWG
ncbi:MAG: ferrous iron transport protein B [Verrucomicrobia bacterium]|nr:MAG: ferrous iron transport protein B [Verrucomicrobiota bacterium]